MKKFASHVSQNTKHGLSKQVLNIAICECENEDNDAFLYFKNFANFELLIQLTDAFTFKNAS
jgi:hypothetical protein